MRQITSEAVMAFLKGNTFGKSNTAVTIENGIRKLTLFGNEIARLLPDGDLYITMAGWGSPTTRERLNALPNVSIWQRNHIQRGCGVDSQEIEIDEDAWYRVHGDGLEKANP